MMLRNRTRAMNKPNLMVDHTTSSQQSQSQSQSPKQNHAPRTLPSLFCSAKFRDFTIKCFSANEALLPSPTSILDTRTVLSPPFGNNFNPFSYDNKAETSSTIISPRISLQNSSEKQSKISSSSYDKFDSKGIGLGLVGALNNEDDEQNVLFGTKLRVMKVPSTFNPFEANKTCFGGVGGDDFGTKTNKDSLSSSQNSGICCGKKEYCSGSGVLTLSEMELSEEYTCVISHGPNPRTTHIFDNFIVESYSSSLPNDNSNNNKHSSSSSSSSVSDFLSFCFTCKKHLEQTVDIFIYRGDRAFCSKECRHQEMVLEGEAENSEFDGY